MSYEGNKRDFEDALKELEEAITALDHCVDEGIMQTLKSVVNEYNTHFKSDIEEMENLVKDLEATIPEYVDAQPPI